MALVERIISHIASLANHDRLNNLSQPNPPQPTVRKLNQPSSESIKLGILLFLLFFLVQMAIASLAGSIIIAPKNDKAAIVLLTIFGGLLKGIINIAKALIK